MTSSIPRPLLLVAHPSPDVYGSDLQLVETVRGAVGAGWRVIVVIPIAGPLVPLLRECGAEVRILAFPVLRKSLLRLRGLVVLGVRLPSALVRMVRLLRRVRPAVVLVNTVTLPVWLLATLLTRTPSVCHVHEAEDDQARLVRTGLGLPLLVCSTVVTNSEAAARALLDVAPGLARRTRVVHNGVAGPPEPPSPPRRRPVDEPAHVVVVGRLSPRKGIDVALDAVAALLAQGRNVRLTVCGTTYPGYEWFEHQLIARAQRPDLSGAVVFAGYVSPTWDVLSSADVVLVPSRREPFGNAAVEALLACRPLVASGVQGLLEVVVDGRTGTLVTPDEPMALAEAVGKVLDEPEIAAERATEGRHDALSRFSVERYRSSMLAILESAGGRSDRFRRQ